MIHRPVTGVSLDFHELKYNGGDFGGARIRHLSVESLDFSGRRDTRLFMGKRWKTKAGTI
jgi:hypothetical protein